MIIATVIAILRAALLDSPHAGGPARITAANAKFRTMWRKALPRDAYSALIEDVSDSVPESKQEADPRVVSRIRRCSAVATRSMKFRSSITSREGKCHWWGRARLLAMNWTNTTGRIALEVRMRPGPDRVYGRSSEEAA